MPGNPNASYIYNYPVKKFLLPLFACAASFLLSSCMTLSENPLSPAETARPDSRLAGTWVGKNEDAPDDVFRFTQGKGAWMRLTITHPDKKEKLESYDLFPSIIGKRTFLNVRTSGKDERGRTVKGYYIVRYSISSSHVLTMWPLSSDAMADAVREGKLKGIVHRNNDILDDSPHSDVDVTLQDSGANLSRFIQSHDSDDVFGDKMNPLKRVGD